MATNNPGRLPNDIRTLARKTDKGDACTPCHSENVANLALEICRALNIRGRRKDVIINACLVHDVGKVAVDARIWAKNGKLTDVEWHRVRMHPLISARLAKEAGLNEEIALTIYYHHVWFNGAGYPYKSGKKGRRIPIGARIIAVCDAYDAMVSARVYRAQLSKEEALEELRQNSARQFDPRVVEILSQIVLGAQAS